MPGILKVPLIGLREVVAAVAGQPLVKELMRELCGKVLPHRMHCVSVNSVKVGAHLLLGREAEDLGKELFVGLLIREEAPHCGDDVRRRRELPVLCGVLHVLPYVGLEEIYCRELPGAGIIGVADQGQEVVRGALRVKDNRRAEVVKPGADRPLGQILEHEVGMGLIEQENAVMVGSGGLPL